MKNQIFETKQFQKVQLNPEYLPDRLIIEEFENEINSWFELHPSKHFEDYLKEKNCILDNNTIIEKNIKLYEELTMKWSTLQVLRFMRKRKPNLLENIKSLANNFINSKEGEIDVATIPF